MINNNSKLVAFFKMENKNFEIGKRKWKSLMTNFFFLGFSQFIREIKKNVKL